MIFSSIQNNAILLFKDTKQSNYEQTDTIVLNLPIEDYFIDTHNNLFVKRENQMYVLKKEFVHLKTSFLKKTIFVSTPEGCTFYYTTGNSLCCMSYKEDAGKETLIKNFNCDFFVTEKNELIYWRGKEFCILSNGSEHTDSLPFDICSILPNMEKFVILDHSNNIYIFNPLRGKLEGGLKSVTNCMISFASSVFMPLVAVATTDRVFILEVATRQLLKTIFISNVKDMHFLSDRNILLINEKVNEYDFITEETKTMLNCNNLKCFGLHSGYRINKSDDLNLIRTLKTEILDLKAEFVKDTFDLRKTIEDLKSRIEKLEEK